MDFNHTKRQAALEWQNVPKGAVARKHWSLLWWVPCAAAFFLTVLGYPWWACMGVAVFCALNASKEATVKNLKLIPGIVRDLIAGAKNGGA